MADAHALGPPRPKNLDHEAATEVWMAAKAKFREGKLSAAKLREAKDAYTAAHLGYAIEGDLVRFANDPAQLALAQRRKAEFDEHGRLLNPRKAG